MTPHDLQCISHKSRYGAALLGDSAWCCVPAVQASEVGLSLPGQPPGREETPHAPRISRRVQNREQTGLARERILV